MTCFEFSLAELLTFSFWNDRASIITAAIATLALAIAVCQLYINRYESRRNTAYSIYQEYLKLCFEYADLSYGKQSDILINGKINNKYPWFIAQMLFAFEQILEIDKNDENWNVAIASQLKKHQWYLKKSKSVERNEWNEKLKDIIKKLDN